MSAAEIPFDLSGAQEALAQKKQLAQLLQQRALTQPQGQMVSGHYVSPGILGHIAPIINALMAGKMNSAVDSEQAALAGKYRDMTKSGLDSYFRTREGVAPVPGIGNLEAPGVMSVDQVRNMMENDVDPAVGTPGDPRKAAIEALTSQIPMLQKLGEMGLTAKPQKPDYSHIKEAGGRFYSLASGRPVELGGNEFGATEEIGGDLYQRGPGGKLIKLDNAPKVSTNVSVDNFGNREALSQAGKNLETARNDLLSAKKVQSSASRMMSLLDDPDVQTGFGAGIGAGLSNLGNKLGFNGPDSAAKTQALAAELAKNVLENAAALKPLSNSDIDFLREVTLGKVDLTREALRDMAGLALAGSHNSTMDALERYNGAASVTGVGEIVKQYPRPPIQSGPLPPKFFEIDPQNRARYRSQLMPAKAKPTGPKAGTRIKLEDL